MSNNIVNYSFIKYPRALIDNPTFSHISIEARTLFAMILDRMDLSEINSDRFTDENGGVYIIYTAEEAGKKLGCGTARTLRIFNELESNGMIIRKRKIRCMPYRIYIAHGISELLKQEFPRFENKNPGVRKIKSPDTSKPDYSNNKKSNNDYSNNQSSITGIEVTEEEIKEQIEYECIVCDSGRKVLDEIVMIICDVLNGSSPTVRIGKDDMPRGAVTARFRKLDSEHISYVISSLESTCTKVRNIKSYLITMLYNAPATLESRTCSDFGYYSAAKK